MYICGTYIYINFGLLLSEKLPPAQVQLWLQNVGNIYFVLALEVYCPLLPDSSQVYGRRYLEQGAESIFDSFLFSFTILFS